MIRVRPYTLSDYPCLLQVQQEAFPPPFPQELWWSEEQIAAHTETFPEGALLVEIDGEVVGSSTSLLVSNADKPHTWEEISDNGFLRQTHDPYGDTLYGIDLCVRPIARGKGVAKTIYDAQKQTVIKLELKRYAAVCRIPGYSAVARHYSPQQYVDLVKSGDYHDTVLSFMLKQGLNPTRIQPNYVEDAESLNYGVFVEWKP
ncbi:GNAT family N-acetyltransferase [Bacillus sp. JCM 19041]|uniref:GNAT family N-acetyltransferase n=1 Tax=Bacillus sp. JCM 19041 TaxID=1460637 RepID=UPI0006D2A612